MAINALALRMGYLEKSIFHVDELLGGPKITDEFQEKLIGNSADNYQESALWLRRAELWAALGEENAMAFHPKAEGKEGKYNATSEKFSELLGIVTRPWVSPIWCRVLMASDPRVDASYEDDEGELKVPSILAIGEIFASQEAAAEVAAEESGGQGEGEKGDGPGLPEAWAEYPDEWATELGSRKAKFDGKLPPAPKLAAMAGELDCTVQDIKEWWESV